VTGSVSSEIVTHHTPELHASTIFSLALSLMLMNYAGLRKSVMIQRKANSTEFADADQTISCLRLQSLQIETALV
jgi:hypothetical protein